MVERYGFIDAASGYEPLYFGKTTDLAPHAISGPEYVLHSDFAELAAENERLKQKLADHPRDTNTVDAHETANVGDKPESQQEPVAWVYELACGYNKETDEYTGWKPGLSYTKPNAGRGQRNVRPLYTRPSEQAVTEAMVVAATEEYYAASFKNTPSDTMRMALKAAMEAGR